MVVSVAAAIATAPLCIPPAQAHADDLDDPCVSITDPAARQACIDEFLRLYRRVVAECKASPKHGQVGQVCG